MRHEYTSGITGKVRELGLASLEHTELNSLILTNKKQRSISGEGGNYCLLCS